METRPAIALSWLAPIVIVAFAIGVLVGIVGHAKYAPCVVVPTLSVQHDTLVRQDTINGIVTPPVIQTVIRRDTIRLPSKPDTSLADTAARLVPTLHGGCYQYTNRTNNV